MTATDPIRPAFPGAAIRPLLVEADALDATTLGACVRLLERAWEATPPCSVPAADDVLAPWAGLTPETWANLRRRVLGSLDAHELGGRLVLRQAAREYHRLLGLAQHARAQRERAGIASARARAERRQTGPPDGNGRSTPVQRAFNGCSTPVQPAAAGRGGGSRAPAESAGALRDAHESERSSAGLRRADVVAVLTEGMELAASVRAEQWRRDTVRGILTRGFEAWRSAGRMPERGEDPRFAASKIAEYPHVTPAAAAIALARAEEAHARRALFNPVGYVIAALGARRGGKPLEHYLSDQPVIDHWTAQAARALEHGRAMHAIRTAADRIERAVERRGT